MMNKRTSVIPVSIYYSLIYMSTGAFTSYIGLYYASLNLGSAAIGLLTSIGALMALLSQPLWGIISDRAASKNTILTLCLLLAGLTIWLMPLSGNIFWFLTLSTAIFFFFQCAINPLSDTITLELASDGAFSFSRIRTMGSLGYAIMAAIAGKIFETHINRIFAVFSALILLAFALVFFIPPVKGHQRGKKQVRLLGIFADRRLIYIYILTFITQATMGFFYAFNAIYSKELGISTQLIGLGVMVGSFSQFPFMIFFDKIYKRIGIINILLLSGAIHAIRWLLYATALTSKTIIFIWILHGFTYIVFYLCLAEYVNNSVVKELKASGQMMNSIMLSGISKIAGGFIGGMISAAIGIKLTFALSAIISAAAVLWFFIVVKTSPVFKEDSLDQPA